MATEYIYNAFVVPGMAEGGNGALVVLNADDLEPTEKQSIVKNAILKDVVFILKSTNERANFRLEYFINQKPTLLSGHATLAAFACMKDQGQIEDGAFSVELVNGRVVYVSHKDGQTFLEQEHPIYEEPAMDDIMGVLLSTGVAMTDLMQGHMPMVVCASNRSMVIGLKSLAALKNIQPNFEKLSQISEGLDIVGFVFFTPETIHAENDFAIRVFAPLYGVNEESASGTLAGALACYIYDLHEAEKETFKIEQGYLMQPARPSLIKVYMETEERKFLGPRVGGFASQATN